MPCVIDDEHTELHHSKRRRVLPDIAMARRKSIGQHDTSTPYQVTTAAFDREQSSSKNVQRSSDNVNEFRTSDRAELMQRIKKGQRPTWVPSANFQALCDDEEAALNMHPGNKSTSEKDDAGKVVEDPWFGPWTEARDPVPQQRPAQHRSSWQISETLSLDCDAPSTAEGFTESPLSANATSPQTWALEDHDAYIGRAISEPKPAHGQEIGFVGRRRAPSLGSSLSSSFVFRTPTSPLAHAVNYNSHGFHSSQQSSHVDSLGDTRVRRRTMPPNAFDTLRSASMEPSLPNFSRPFSTSRRNSSWAHQPRRSLSSFTYQPSSNPQTPQLRARRLSMASEGSPRNRTTMVGSFEESILRGRMSSPASQPFDFVAQIGVMGRGECPSNLKCPPHVTVPFKAVFYHYPSVARSRSVSDDAPSPYVGTIDLENSLKPIYLSTRRKRKSEADVHASLTSEDPRAPENTPIGRALARDVEKNMKRSTSPHISLGGAYRVPERGLLQIIIKNQNKTAVKLFLVPYDLEGMDAGTKTFIRQRSYSHGPIIEGALDTTAGTAGSHDPLKDKSILRYLVHLKFCCPARGKYYLHDNIRVVFANRMPDGKEKLDNEIQLPEPRYSMFRPAQRSRTLSRASTGDSVTTNPTSDVFSSTPQLESSFTNFFAQSLANHARDTHETTADETEYDLRNLQPLAFHLAEPQSRSHSADKLHHTSGNTEDSEPPLPILNFDSPRQQYEPLDSSRTLSPIQGFRASISPRSSPVPGDSPGPLVRSFSPAPVEAGDGLLSRQFRHLNDTKGNKPSNLEHLGKQTDIPQPITNDTQRDISSTNTNTSHLESSQSL